MWKKRYINSSTSYSVPKDVPGSSSSESEDENLDLSLGPATCLHAQDLSGSDSDPSVEQEEFDSLSDEDLSDVEELLATFTTTNTSAAHMDHFHMACLFCPSLAIQELSTRKLCGFLGHSAKRGCPHSYKIFPGSFGEHRNYSGFDDRDQENLALITIYSCIVTVRRHI
ncbi:hypothetical protein ACROYT_G003224 [Oculina patagonica]